MRLAMAPMRVCRCVLLSKLVKTPRAWTEASSLCSASDRIKREWRLNACRSLAAQSSTTSHNPSQCPNTFVVGICGPPPTLAVLRRSMSCHACQRRVGRILRHRGDDGLPGSPRLDTMGMSNLFGDPVFRSRDIGCRQGHVAFEGEGTAQSVASLHVSVSGFTTVPGEKVHQI